MQKWILVPQGNEKFVERRICALTSRGRRLCRSCATAPSNLCAAATKKRTSSFIRRPRTRRRKHFLQRELVQLRDENLSSASAARVVGRLQQRRRETRLHGRELQLSIERQLHDQPVELWLRELFVELPRSQHLHRQLRPILQSQLRGSFHLHPDLGPQRKRFLQRRFHLLADARCKRERHLYRRLYVSHRVHRELLPQLQRHQHQLRLEVRPRLRSTADLFVGILHLVRATKPDLSRARAVDRRRLRPVPSPKLCGTPGVPRVRS